MRKLPITNQAGYPAAPVRFTMCRLHFIFVALLVGFSAARSAGAERPQHNFLFIVDSSVSMAPHKSTAVKWVRDTIATRFDDQIEAGDSIDIWTYDTENNLRGFPPQIWQPQDAKTIGDTAAAYLEKYPFQGRSDFSQVASDLALLVPQTKALLIVIITDGEEPFSGISLDLAINGYLAKKGRIGPEAAAKGPLVVSLSAIGGALRTWTAYFGQGVIDLATLPERTKLTGIAAAAKPQTNPKATRQQPIARTPEVKAQPVIPSGETKFVFDFPAGAKFNSIDGTRSDNALERPLEFSKSASAITKASAATNISLAVMQTNSPSQAVLSNVLTTTVTPPSARTNLARTAIAQTNVAKAQSPLVKSTNAAVVVASSNLPATAVNVAKVANSPSNAALAAASAKNTIVGAPAALQTSVSESSTLSHYLTARNAMYAVGFTGFACVFAGLLMIVRKFRRPTQSIISRSLLQR